MKKLADAAKLNSKEYTNHSMRATCIGTLDNKGFEARHITAISSHKRESTIKTLLDKMSRFQEREMYDALNESIIPKKQKNSTAQDMQGTLVNEPAASTINKNKLF